MRALLLQRPDGELVTAIVPETRVERVRGLLGRDGLEPDEALLLKRTRSVHTFGMRFPIAVVLLDDDLRVVAVKRMVPRRFLLPRLRVRHVLECHPEVDLRPGDSLHTLDPGPPGTFPS